MVRHQLQGRHGHAAGQPRRPRGSRSCPGSSWPARVEESTSPDFTPGQRVLVQGYDLGVARHGGFAAYARVPADWVVPLPDALSCRNAAIIGLAGFTALLSLRRLAPARDVTRGRTHPRHRGLRGRRQRGGGAAGQRGFRGGGLVGQDGRARLPRGPRRGPGGGTPVHRGRRARRSGPSSGPASWTASAARHWPRRCARSATAAPWPPAGSRAATTWRPPSTRSSCAAWPCSGSTPWRPRSRSGGPCGRTWPSAFPLDRCEEMVNEEIGLDGLTAALDRVLDAAVRGPDPRRPGRPARRVLSPRRPATPGWSRCRRGRWPGRTWARPPSRRAW